MNWRNGIQEYCRVIVASSYKILFYTEGIIPWYLTAQEMEVPWDYSMT